MKSIKVFSLILCLNIVVYAGQLNWEIHHDLSQLSFNRHQQYDVVFLEEGRVLTPFGSPALPSISMLLSIPPTSQVLSVKVEDEAWMDLGNFNIAPSQPAYPLNMEPVFVSPNPQIYSYNSYYPENLVLSFNTGNKSGFMLAGINYCPFRYNPVTRSLQLLSFARLIIEYQEGLEEVIYLTPGQINLHSEDVMDMVSNPFEVMVNAPLAREARDPLTEYVIVTPSDLVSSFEPLIQWKRQKGISAQVVSADWVYANYNGRDDMEKIREFVKEYHQNHGLIYFIMAGDYDNLGARLANISVPQYGFYLTTPSDLYFSDVVPYNSDWDANQNDSFGEYEVDSCDFYSDVYVGRFPLNTPTEASRWVNKVLTYEQNPPSGFIERSLMGGAMLYQDSTYYLSGKFPCDSIADNHLPSWWEHVKLYEYDTISPPPSGFTDSISSGFGWCHLGAHGSIYAIYWYVDLEMMISIYDNPTNGMKLGVIHAISCESGHFDGFECCGEHYFNAPQGGAIAVILNARGGFSDTLPPYLGPSGWINVWTANECFSQENWNIGVAHGLGKDHIIIGMNRTYHYSLNGLNLFGDPETQIYSREPSLLEVTHFPVISISPGTFNVEVNSSGNPVLGAICCLYNPIDSTLWFVDTTDAFGVAQIVYDSLTQDSLVLTVYAHDYLCYQDTLIIANSYVVFIELDSISGGYNNNHINGGCSYDASISVLNFGSSTLDDVKGILSSTSPFISLDPDTLMFGNISANDTAVSSNFAGFTISGGVADSTVIPIELVCWDVNDSVWTSRFSLIVIAPQLEIHSLEGPLTVSPGDSFYISPKITNSASGTAYSPEIICRLDDPYITVHDSLENPANIPPDTQIKLDSIFYLSISSSCPEPYFADLLIVSQSSGGYEFIDTLTMGTPFFDNFESGDTGWTYSGPSSWHITGHNSHQGSHSMYCGEEGTWQYASPVPNARVITPDLFVSAGSQLSFWHWYDIYDNYDKVQLQISTDNGSTWELVNPEEGYTGTWGYSPYDSIYTGQHQIWEQHHVALDITGEVIISWLFFSNTSNSAEGYYFDDVVINANSGFVGIEEEQIGLNPNINYQYSLQKAYPNLISSRVVIQYSLGTEVPVKLTIYDITGREITTLVNQSQGPGNYQVEWNSRDNHGVLVSSGTYFYRLSAGSFTAGEKLIIVR